MCLNTRASFNNQLIGQHEVAEHTNSELPRSYKLQTLCGATTTKLKHLRSRIGTAYQQIALDDPSGHPNAGVRAKKPQLIALFFKRKHYVM